MPERIQDWWARRQFSRGTEVPYPVGTYREAWAHYPVLVKQYRPEFNDGITLTQIPPAADVLLLWQCEVGHYFVATPTEQRERPGRERRRSSWCPECLAMAKPKPVQAGVPVASKAKPRKPAPAICHKTPQLPAGEAFVSECAPKPASAVEEQLRADLFERLALTQGYTAVKVSRPFFQHLEVWPDILLPELRVAIEYDSTGRHGLEHVGKREETDRRKDRALRAAGWEVVRIRTGKLQPIGPYDLQMSSVTERGLTRLVDVLRDIRGPLMVDAYLR
ncbi:endonuclease domain-containing protein [Salinibacterium sp. SYSU T00001]|uniref:endonuclease domain-containing protein n=1 Tax=Homoserinimonas sedimenticola TaxID=2986805 RepID=UPI0022356121|nr:endonuclease domain-containing protein [Salinibacterium sedimenticola]MCW4386178.1 endonuclease domain-containing protein [Salinibacterium sedimenticola]